MIMPDIDTEKSSWEPRIQCEVCRKEVPKSLARSAETQEYVLFFCGLECFAAWKDSAKKEVDQ
ncbi:MAG: DUF3330 domain-containing protein [Gammaproteobacteria bacterium]|jgi:hypothetical protein